MVVGVLSHGLFWTGALYFSLNLPKKIAGGHCNDDFNHSPCKQLFGRTDIMSNTLRWGFDQGMLQLVRRCVLLRFRVCFSLFKLFTPDDSTGMYFYLLSGLTSLVCLIFIAAFGREKDVDKSVKVSCGCPKWKPATYLLIGELALILITVFSFYVRTMRVCYVCSHCRSYHGTTSDTIRQSKLEQCTHFIWQRWTHNQNNLLVWL